MTFTVTGLSKAWAEVTASFQKLYATGKPDGDAFSVGLTATAANNTYQKSSLAKGDWTVTVCESGKDAWSEPVKFAVPS